MESLMIGDSLFFLTIFKNHFNMFYIEQFYIEQFVMTEEVTK